MSPRRRRRELRRQPPGARPPSPSRTRRRGDAVADASRPGAGRPGAREASGGTLHPPSVRHFPKFPTPSPPFRAASPPRLHARLPAARVEGVRPPRGGAQPQALQAVRRRALRAGAGRPRGPPLSRRWGVLPVLHPAPPPGRRARSGPGETGRFHMKSFPPHRGPFGAGGGGGAGNCSAYHPAHASPPPPPKPYAPPCRFKGTGKSRALPIPEQAQFPAAELLFPPTLPELLKQFAVCRVKHEFVLDDATASQSPHQPRGHARHWGPERWPGGSRTCP